ncbi:MAG TPA: TauD/TfdA family dioxygenase [Allocoleopsis sp.]
MALFNHTYEFYLPQEIKDDFHKNVRAIGNFIDSDSERFIQLCQIVASQFLPAHYRVLHDQIRNNNGFIVIRNLPLDTQLPQTPANGLRPQGKTSVSEAVLLGVVSALGYKPFAYAQEKNGALVHEIAPIAEKACSISSNGIADFDFHTDCSHLERKQRPHILALFCLRDASQTPTKLTRLGDVLERMNPHEVLELMQNNFIHTPPETFEDKTPISNPVLRRSGDKIEVAVSTHNVQPTTKNARLALESFHQLAHECHLEIQWNPGDMLIFNNLRCLHARGAITGDRWLQRCYGTEMLQSPRTVDLNNVLCSVPAA